MTQGTDANLNPQRKVSRFWVLLIGLVGILAIMLLLPSARDNRLAQLRRSLAENYPKASADFMKPLLASHLLTKEKFIYDAGQKECVLFVFSPDPGSYYSVETMIGEISNPLLNYSEYEEYWNKIPKAVLLAPEEKFTGWTMFAKIWIVKALQKQKVDDLLQLGTELTTNKAALTRLKKIWGKIPLKLQKRAEQILDENRKIARQYALTPRFYRNESTYIIDNHWEVSDFIWNYMGANPAKFPKEYR